MFQKYLISTVFFILIAFFSHHVEGRAVKRMKGGYDLENPLDYQVSIFVLQDPFSRAEQVCVGTAITRNLVLSIAHSFISINGEMIVRWYEVYTHHGKSYGVSEIYVPNDFKGSTFQNDLSVLKTTGSMDVVPLPEPASDLTYEGEEAILTSFDLEYLDQENAGIFRKGNKIPKLSKYMRVKIHSNAERWTKGDFLFTTQMSASAITQDDSDRWGACYGDEGGPLLFGNTVIGVLSKYNRRCVDAEIAAIYTRVSSFLSFIKSLKKDIKPPNSIVLTHRNLYKSFV